MILLAWITLFSLLGEASCTAGVVSTLIGYCCGDGGEATSANMISPTGVTLDSSGNLYTGSFNDYKIRKVTSTGTISSVVGSGIGYGTSGAVEGSGTSASVNIVYDVALDSSNNLYIADTGNHKIRKLTVSTGIVTTYACSGNVLSIGINDQDATSTSCYYPYGVALDSSDNVYVADTYHNQVRKVSATGLITAFAGTGVAGFTGDAAAATSAKLYYPKFLAVDSSDNVYIADFANNRIRKVTVLTGIITTIAGSTSSYGYSGDGGAATSATFKGPNGLALDASGNVFIVDTNNHCVRKVTVSTGIITTYAGTGTGGYSGDGGQATSATLQDPVGLHYYSSSSSLYIGDMNNRVVRKITSTEIISTVAGHTLDTSQSTSAALSSPWGVAVDASGNVYVSEYTGYLVKKMTISSGIVSNIAGSGSTSSSGDGAAATSGGIYSPSGIAVDTSGNVYIAETRGNKIRKLTVSSGFISTVVGTGTAGTCTSGLAPTSTSCMVNNPMAIEVDSSGNVYYSDSFNHKVMKVSTGIVTTIAGSGSSSTDGDGNSATSAAINKPYGFVFDATGNIIITEYGSHKVRKVTVATGLISTIAGTGSSSYSGDGGHATSATLNSPSDVAIDSFGDIYVSDSGNNMIRKITVSTSIISTIAGSSTSGSYTGNNIQATSATFNTPFAIAIDGANNLYVTDASNSAVRKIEGSTSAPTYAPSPTPTTIIPTVTPTSIPSTATPSKSPTSTPTIIPTVMPTLIPSPLPTAVPSAMPTHAPAITPTSIPSSIPTFVPSTSSSPSTIMPSNFPTIYPSNIPTTFPTYISSIRVTFFVYHEFEGSSAGDFDISKGSSCSNAIIDSIIASLSPYPVSRSDIDLLAVQNASTAAKSLLRAAVSASSDMIALRYMVDIDTQIFDNIDDALGIYISTLNESIAMGYFDAYLYANAAYYGVNNLNNTVSKVAIFTTASPTLNPTSFPTSSTPTSYPTKVNILALNGFDTVWDSRYVNTKAQFYLASYIIYFIGIYLMLYFLDMLGLYKQFLAKLQLSSFHSNIHKVFEHEWREQDSGIKRLAKLCKQNKELFDTENNWRASTTRRELETTNELDDVFRESDSDLDNGNNNKNKSRSSRLSGLHNSIRDYFRRISSYKGKTSSAYSRYLRNKRTLLMADPYLYPYGIEVTICSTTMVLPMGIIEDYALFVCNNHQVISCIFGMEDNASNRSSRRLIYCIQNIVSFFISAFTGSLFNYFEFGVIFSQLFDAVVVSPISLTVADFIRYLYKLQIVYNAEGVDDRTIIHKFMIKVLIVFIFLSSFVLLFLAALFTYNQNKSGIIFQYFTQVQIVCFFYEIILSIMLFVPHYHYNLSLTIPRVYNLSFINIGQLYLEKIMKYNSNDYVCYRTSILGGFLVANYVISRDYAFKKGWVATEEVSTPSLKEESTNIPKMPRMSTNPLLRGDTNPNPIKTRWSMEHKSIIEMPTVTKSTDPDPYDDEIVSLGNIYATHDTFDSNIVVEYTSSLAQPRRSHNTVSDKSMVQNPLRRMNEPTEVEEDDTLFQLYHTEVSRGSKGGNKEMTFEEWKIQRKQFNSNTRKSFINSYRVFEDLEEVAQQKKGFMNKLQFGKKGPNNK